jgi:aminodeoxyfutalosine synthase
VALNFGATDLDGTIGVEKIAHAAQARSPVGMAEDSMVQTIREAGRLPVQRDALYHVVREYGPGTGAGAVAGRVYQRGAGADAADPAGATRAAAGAERDLR